MERLCCSYAAVLVLDSTKVTRGTGENAKETSYVYDSMGQLIRVNDQTDTTSSNDGTTWVYEYDCGGNILSKTRYPYTTETPAADGVTINYTYGNSNWKDQLTEYNGATIQYDNIGNPTDDGTWTYTWENGRQLKELHRRHSGLYESRIPLQRRRLKNSKDCHGDHCFWNNNNYY